MQIKLYPHGLSQISASHDLRQGHLHVVFVAVNGLTFLNAITVAGSNYAELNEGRISNEIASFMCNQVNEMNTTGTLFPELNVSLMPLTIYKERNDWDQSLKMNKIIQDALSINKQHIKSKEILFAFESREDFDHVLALEVLEEIALDYNDEILETIYFFE